MKKYAAGTASSYGKIIEDENGHKIFVRVCNDSYLVTYEECEQKDLILIDEILYSKVYTGLSLVKGCYLKLEYSEYVEFNSDKEAILWFKLNY